MDDEIPPGDASVQFHVRLIDDPSAAETRLNGREAHWSYLDDHADHFFGRGPTFVAPDRFLSTVFFLEFADWDAIRHFIANEPHNRNGVYRDIKIWRWRDEHGRRQRDFPREGDAVAWYLRGFGRRDAHDDWQKLQAEHDDYCRRHDLANFVVRGGIFDEAGEIWEGSAALVALPDRESVDAFLDKEPLNRNGLYDDFLIQRFKFGGRPGQVT